MSVEHAKHNEELCLKLFEDGIWNDWVVTTAFYSAIHFVDSRLFPLKVKDTEYRDLDEYFPSSASGSRSKHEARTKLVQERLRMAYSSYKLLQDVCKTARYVDYKISPDLAKTAKMKLAVVKSLCVSSTPTSTK